MIEQLNYFEKENSTNNIIPIERYFKEMDLFDDQIKEREKFAKELKDLFMLFFLLFRGNKVAGNIQDIDYYNLTLNRQYKELLESYSLISYLDNDMVNAYIPLMIASAINTTYQNQEEPYTLSEERAEFMATDQTNTVFNEVDYNKAIKNGATHKRWITEKDERVRKTHKSLDDKVLPIKELYHVGSSLMRFPKDTKYEDGNILRQIIGCRCSIKYLDNNKQSVLNEDTRIDAIDYSEYKNATTYNSDYEVSRKNIIINSKKSAISKNNIYISDESTIDDIGVEYIDSSLAKAVNIHNIKKDELPTFVIISSLENVNLSLASYNPYKNVMFIDENMAKKSFVLEMQKSMAKGEIEYSTYVHELFHVKDALKYKKIYGKVDSNYEEWIQTESKKHIAEVQSNGYNIVTVSHYSADSFNKGKYDEVVAEYNTYRLLGK